MRVSIRTKLMATYIFISLLTATFIFLLTYFTSEQRLQKLTLDYQLQKMANEVENWYLSTQSLNGFRDYFHSLHPKNIDSQQDTQLIDHSKRQGAHGVVGLDKKAILPYLDFAIGEQIPEVYFIDAKAVRANEQIIAWIIPADEVGIGIQSELKIFLGNLKEILLISVCIALLASITLGLFLATRFLKPILSLTQASSAIATGELQQTVMIKCDDEIGDLTTAFNQMSEDLVIMDKQRKQLTADVTHEMGTPVQVISGYIEMAQQGVLELDKKRIDIIAIELEHIKRSIKDMSLLSATDAKTLSLEISKTDINALLERVASLYSHICQEQGITLNIDKAEYLPLVDLDEERMVQVFANLISNAIRYTPNQGHISVYTTVFDDQKTQQQKLSISVEDNGCGIHEKDLPFIFNRFYRADASRCGSLGKMGLGLAITKGLIEMQDGELSVDSKGPQQGSCFTMTFAVPNS